MNNQFLESQNLPLISVIIPVYNVEPYLRACLDSVLNQIYSNLEIIIIASTSDDKSCDICYEYERKDFRITVIASDPNGLSDARNKGISASRGDFICFIDSDDFIDSNFISVLYNIIKKYACDIAQCNYYEIDEVGNILSSPTFLSEETVHSGLDMCYSLYDSKYAVQSVVSWSKLYKRELFRSIKFPTGKIHEDEATSYKLFFSSEKVGITSQKLYYYRQRRDSIMGRKFSHKNLDYLDALDKRLLFYKERCEMELYALTLDLYSRVFPTYLYNVKQLSGDNDLIMSTLSRRYVEIKHEAIRCKEISFCAKLHMILVWLYPRTKYTMRLLDRVRKISYC